MMINDFDDERTMEEEEALGSQEDEAEELDDLTKEQDMPLEELLKLYNYGGVQPSPPPSNERRKERGRKKKKKHKVQANIQDGGPGVGDNVAPSENKSLEDDNNMQEVCHKNL